VNIPSELKYTADHEWVKVSGTTARIGITDYAQDALGDVVFVAVPQVGATVAAGESFGEVESTKSVSEIYAPLAGKVITVNTALESAPELMNDDPYGEGWLCDIQISDSSASESLLDAAAYRALIEG
jgi:glycine cleavage system H protein